jgi:dihydroneopterin aldolase
MLTVSLKGAVFNAPIGIYPQEQPIRNQIEVDIEVQVEAAIDTLPLIDYQVLYQIAANAVQQAPPLLEDVVKTIIQEVSGHHPQAQIDVCVRKLNPPMGGVVANCAVRFVKKI